MSELVIDAKDPKGFDVKLVLKSPTSVQIKEAQLASARAFQEGIKQKLMFRERLQQSLKEQGIWDDVMAEELKAVTHELNEGERRLAKGGANGFKKADAKKLAIKMRELRIRQAELLTKSSHLDEYTVEAYAENAKFDYFVSACTFYDDGRNVYKNLDDYRERASEEMSVLAATNLAKLIHEFNENWQSELPENKFLLKYGFVNKDLRFVNADGHLVDEDGRLINEEGRFVNENNEFVDREGNKVDDNGKPVEEFVEFAEDE